MTQDERLERGKEMFRKCYGEVLPLAEGGDPDGLHGLTLRNLFNDIWGREGLSFRDRRLIVLGALMGMGADPSLFEIHVKSALANGEITTEELREALLMALPYVGYPKTSPLVPIVEKCIAAHNSRA